MPIACHLTCGFITSSGSGPGRVLAVSLPDVALADTSPPSDASHNVIKCSWPRSANITEQLLILRANWDDLPHPVRRVTGVSLGGGSWTISTVSLWKRSVATRGAHTRNSP